MSAVPPSDFECPRCGLTAAELRDEEARQQHVRALLEERHGYETRGLTDRVATIDEQLLLYGHEAADAPRRERATRPRGEQRRVR